MEVIDEVIGKRDIDINIAENISDVDNNLI